ncbi:MAG: hypothetical protein PHE49_06880 [bacterium]|nr:hypothetical protein [bacterium]
MVQPVTDVSMIPAATTPNAHKVKKPEEEQKFAHQLEHLVVKEEKESDKAKKVGEDEKQEAEAKKKKKGNQNPSNENQNLSTNNQEGEEKNEKGQIIDISA